MQKGTFIAILFLLVSYCSSQDTVKPPVFPDVFQTEIGGIFIKKDRIVELDGDLYYDRINNRAAIQFTYEGETSRSIYNFNSNELVSFDGDDCAVESIPENPIESFFAFKIEKGKKKIASPSDILFFSNSTLLRQEFSVIPTLVYLGKIDIPSYGRKNCEVMHFFSKPVVEMPNCDSNHLCESSLMSISVQCKNEDNTLQVNHIYNFFRFTSGIVDESIFMPPPGIYCNIKNTLQIPPFSSYFSFSFDATQSMKESKDDTTVFSKRKNVWYDGESSIIRIDEYDTKDLLTSSRIFDSNAATEFTIIPIVSKCSMGPIADKIDFAKITTLPKIFFDNETSETAVYVGQRIVHGLNYHTWSYSWTDSISAAMIVEEVFFLEIILETESLETQSETTLKISHIDKYTYETRAETDQYELTALEHIAINNYKISPKEWDAFDVATCFNRTQKKEFFIKIEGDNIVRESEAYHMVLEQLYNKIIAVTSSSVLRISELTGMFDGNKLIGVKGSILDNSEVSGWKKDGQPEMEEIFNRMKKAALQGNLSFTEEDEKSKIHNFKVLSVEDLAQFKETKSNCYSGASMAAASLVLLSIGMFFGIAGYYVFLKKRKPSDKYMYYMKNPSS